MIRSLYTTVAPSIEPVTVEEAKLFCKVDGADDDALIGSLVKAAREASEKRTGRAYITQTVKLVGAYDRTFITLPRPPFGAITTVKYLDGNEAWQAMTVTTDYLTSTQGQVGTITLVNAPYVNSDGEVVLEVVYTAGYGATAASVPEALRQAILHRVAAMYEHRGADSADMKNAHGLENAYRLVLP